MGKRADVHAMGRSFYSFKPRGLVDTEHDLPEDAEDGDTYYCVEDGFAYVYDGQAKCWIYYDGES